MTSFFYYKRKPYLKKRKTLYAGLDQIALVIVSELFDAAVGFGNFYLPAYSVILIGSF
jgi:hypothetical protein